MYESKIFAQCVIQLGEDSSAQEWEGEAQLTSPGPTFFCRRQANLSIAMCSVDVTLVRSLPQWQLLTNAAGLWHNHNLNFGLLRGQEATDRLIFFFLIAILLCVSHYQSHQLKQVVFLKLLIFLGSFLYVPNLALFVNLASVLWEFQPSFPSLFPGLGETCFQKEALEILWMEIGTTL